MKKTCLMLVALFVFMLGEVSAGPAGPYPEYGGIFTLEGSVQYSLPEFGGKTHYWVRYWNANGRYDDAGKTHWDGVAYDGRLLYSPNVSRREGRVYFRLESPELDRKYYGRVIERYFLPQQVVTDPRLTNWWMAFGGEKSTTLRGAVEKGALSKGFPDITEAIIDHMVASKVILREEIPQMTAERIKEAIGRYTNIALLNNLEETRRVIGQARLTPEKLSKITKGDVIESYNWYRFGPYPIPAHVAKVVKVERRKLVVKTINGDESLELDLVELAGNEFIALRRK